MIQSSVKSTRYVSDGEVDPSIRALAERTLFHPGNFAGAAVPRLTELDGWLFASRFGGFDSRIVDSMTGPTDTWEPPVFVEKLKKNWGDNRLAFEAMELSADENDALLFFRGDVENWNQTFQDESAAGTVTEDDIRLLAKSIASSVPPLGRVWITKLLTSDGVAEGTAASKALDVYAKGGNLVAFERTYARRKVITALLRLRDSNVAEEQIDRVVMSPMSLEEVRAKFAPKRSTTGPRTGTGDAGSGGGMGLLFIVAAVAGGALLLRKRK